MWNHICGKWVWIWNNVESEIHVHVLLAVRSNKWQCHFALPRKWGLWQHNEKIWVGKTREILLKFCKWHIFCGKDHWPPLLISQTSKSANRDMQATQFTSVTLNGSLYSYIISKGRKANYAKREIHALAILGKEKKKINIHVLYYACTCEVMCIWALEH